MGEFEHMRVTYEFLKEATGDFSNEIGRGRYGVVYKGQDSDGQELAVKKFYSADKWGQRDFERLVSIYAKIKHPNFNQLLGYCYETTRESVWHAKMLLYTDKLHMALCFEYMHNGNLHHYLHDDEDHVLGWHKRYRIIKGICEGLRCLHMDFRKPILHLNLKPTNILLDGNRVPKIAELGFSKLQDYETTSHDEWLKYCSPEFKRTGEISTKNDIFSLGVIIIEIMVGHKDYPLASEMDAHGFIEHVCNKWMRRLLAIPEYTRLDADCQRVKNCIEIGLRCILKDRDKRPTIADIVEQLNQSGKHINDSTVGTEEDLVSRVKSLIVQQGTSVTQGDANSERMGEFEHMRVTYEFLKEATGDFSNEIGRGRYGVVYKGQGSDGQELAVKKFCSADKWGQRDFERLVRIYAKIKHPNFHQLLGYCYETTRESVWHAKMLLYTEKSHMALCFEYMHNGNLHHYLHDDEDHVLGWHKRYRIIKGICEGLRCLHMDFRKPILHLNLKPTNILLDGNMVPKIAELGFSKLQDYETTSHDEWLKYCSPEFKRTGEISTKNDIFSLGVIIIEIMVGHKDYPLASEMDAHGFIEHVCNKWMTRLLAIPGYTRLDADCQRVKNCIEIGLRCILKDRDKRPTIADIVEQLNQSGKHINDSAVWTEEDLVSRVKSLIVQQGTSVTQGDPNSEDLVPRVKSLTVQQGTSVTQGDANSEVVRTFQGLYPETVHEDSSYMELNILERIVNESEKPGPLDFTLLHSITENFSEKNKIGSGGCGIVYKGILPNGVVAVKKLHNSRTIKNKMFHREVLNLISVKHQNIVRFLGYCSFTKEHAVPYEGITIMADIRERLLCFEYISNGSLGKHLSDELRGLEWQTRYQIIIGICSGLCYLHKDKEIIHMDLKPGNILLDDLMVPKITDFGLSRSISDSQATTTLLISQGYAAPEYISRGKATRKSDIYSLGVIIIELVTGSRTKPNITKVIRRWNHRWIKPMKQSSLAYQQVKKCLELALRCIQDDPTDRPDISDIIDELKEIDTKDGQTQFQISPCCLEDILGIEPMEIHIPFEDLKISHSIELTNDTDDYIAFVTKAKLDRFCTEPDRGIVPPRSKCSVTLAMQARVNARPNEHYKEVITVLSTRVDGGALAAMDIVTAGDIFVDGKEGKVVDEVNVMVVFGTPELPEEE